MSNNLKNILEYKSRKVEADRIKIYEILSKELLNFNFEEDYLKQGDLHIGSASEIIFHSCVIENFTETRSISESSRPNRSGVPLGNKRISEFNVWDYKLSFDEEFQNSTDTHDILESHHAIGCGTCKQQGKLRCSSCRGAGDVTCSSCDGRGEKQCGNCNGAVDIKCWSCSGKGTKETGYGENKRTERCSSCSGRGSNKCTRCSNGHVTCSKCSGRGRVTCYTCLGSGDVTCFQCVGNRTMDHFFTVSSNFINLSQTLNLTNPYPGFDQNKSKAANFNIKNVLFEIQEQRFKESHFKEIISSPFFKQITSFLDFQNNENTRSLKSRITCYENKYFEVEFDFHGEHYTIFLDQNYTNSYYNGKIPSDQYELDLLKKTIEYSIKNELINAKNTIHKLAKYDFIGISEKEIIVAIEDTERIYQAYSDFNNKKYTSSEKILKLLSETKKSEHDYISLRKKIYRIYNINTLTSWLIGLPILFFILYSTSIGLVEFNSFGFVIINLFSACTILIVSIFLNKRLKNINYARFSVQIFLSIQSFFAYNYIQNQHDINRQVYEKSLERLWPFKKIITTKFSELGYFVTDVVRENDNGDFWVKYKNSDSINSGKEYSVRVVALLDGYVEIKDEIIDLTGNEETRKAEISRFFKNRSTTVLYIKLINSDERLNKYTYEVPVTFIALDGHTSLYWIYKVNIVNGSIASMGSPDVIDKKKYDQLASQQPNNESQNFEFSLEEATEIYDKFSTAIRTENIDDLRSCLASVMNTWHNKSSINRETVIGDWTNRYVSKWSVSKDELIELVKGKRLNEFRYKKSYSIYSKNNVSDIRDFEISGYFILDGEKNIIEMKDEITNRVN